MLKITRDRKPLRMVAFFRHTKYESHIMERIYPVIQLSSKKLPSGLSNKDIHFWSPGHKKLTFRHVNPFYNLFEEPSKQGLHTQIVDSSWVFLNEPVYIPDSYRNIGFMSRKLSDQIDEYNLTLGFGVKLCAMGEFVVFYTENIEDMKNIIVQNLLKLINYKITYYSKDPLKLETIKSLFDTYLELSNIGGYSRDGYLIPVSVGIDYSFQNPSIFQSINSSFFSIHHK